MRHNFILVCLERRLDPNKRPGIIMSYDIVYLRFSEAPSPLVLAVHATAAVLASHAFSWHRGAGQGRTVALPIKGLMVEN